MLQQERTTSGSAGSTTTSHTVPLSAWSDVARANATSSPVASSLACTSRYEPSMARAHLASSRGWGQGGKEDRGG